MTAICPSCSWPEPVVVSSHGPVRYLRCVCGRWLVLDGGDLVAAPGASQFAAAACGSSGR